MIGIISDTHDNLPAIKDAVKFFNKSGVSHVLHAGDFVSPFTVRAFKALKCPMLGVYGNNDGEREGLSNVYRAIGAQLRDVVEVEFGGKKIAIYHGQTTEVLSALIACGKYDVVVTGHTHESAIKTEGRTMVINSGEACGYLTGKRTVALLDTSSMTAEIHEF